MSKHIFKDINGNIIKDGDILLCNYIVDNHITPNKDINVVKFLKKGFVLIAISMEEYKSCHRETLHKYEGSAGVLKGREIIGHFDNFDKLYNYDWKEEEKYLNTWCKKEVLNKKCNQQKVEKTSKEETKSKKPKFDYFEESLFFLGWIFYILFIAVGFYVVGEKILNLLANNLQGGI